MSGNGSGPPITIKNDGSFLEQFKRLQQMQQASSTSPKPEATSAASTSNTMAGPSKPTIKNDGSFLNEFKKIQDSSPKLIAVKQESDKSMKPKLEFGKSRFVPMVQQKRMAPKMTDVFDLDYDQEEQTLIDSIAERVVNGSPNEEKIIRAKSLANEELRFAREPHTEAGKYYLRALKRLRAKKAEKEKVEREAREAAQQIRAEQERSAEADAEGDGDELRAFQRKVMKKRSSDAPSASSSGNPDLDLKAFQERVRKQARKSRWSDATPSTSAAPPLIGMVSTPQLSQEEAYARQVTGGELSEEQKKQLVYQKQMNEMYEMITTKQRAQQEAQKALEMGRPTKGMYAYDSDEETEGGTWEHKMRQKEMAATRDWADELTRQNKGNHHIGSFLPPDELAKFMETYKALKEGREPDLSDYKEFKISCENIGYKLLQGMGWEEGKGLGPNQQGIVNPINKGTTSMDKSGLGEAKPHNLSADDDEFDAYRKRMMLAYRFRPNPLNNPRRAYY